MTLRTLLVAFAVLGVGAIVVYVASNTHWEDTTIPVPLRGEAVTNPFYAAQKLAEALGAATERRETLGTLTEEVDVLVLSNWHWDLIGERRDQIERWVEAGGRLVVDKTLTGGGDFGEWSSIGWEYSSSEDEEDAARPESEAEPAPPPAIEHDIEVEVCGTFEEVDEAGTVRTDGRQLSVCNIDAVGHIGTDSSIEWGYAHEGELQAARVEVGGGSVTVLNATPFGNRELAAMDHGKLFVGATNLRAGDRIVFMSEHEHTSLLGLIWLHGAPVVMLSLALLAALLWRGGMRFGPLAAPTDVARRSLAEQIRGTGQFAMRLGDGKALQLAAIRALQEAARKRIARYESLSHHERIAAIAEKSGIEPESLAAVLNHTGPRRATELAHAIALLETARRRILE